MNNLEELRETRKSRMQEIEALLEKDPESFDEEAETKFDELHAEVERIDAQLERGAKAEALAAKAREPEPAVGERAVVSALGESTHPHRGPEAKTSFESLGEFMSAVRFNPDDQRLHFQAAQRMKDGSQGGFAVPEQFSDQILEVGPQDAIVRPRAAVIEAGDPPDAAINIPALDQTGAQPHNRYGGVEVRWTGEGGTKHESEAKLRMVKLQPQEVAGLIYVTDQLLRNWASADTFLRRQLGGALRRAEDRAFWRGDGVAKPKGVIEADAAYKVTRDTGNTIKYVDLVNMEERLLDMDDAVWVCTPAGLSQLRQLQDPAGRYIWTGADTAARDGQAGILLGRPVIKNERSPALGSLGDIALVSLQHYLVKDGSGPFVAMSEHVKFADNQTAVKIFKLVDGQPWLTETFKLENSFEASPFVLLDVP